MWRALFDVISPTARPPLYTPLSPLYLPCISPGDQLDATGKLDLLLLVCARVAAGCCAPDRGNHSGQNV